MNGSTSIPPGWSSVPLGAVGTEGGGLFTDGDWILREHLEHPGNDIRLLQLADIGVGRFRDRSAKWISREVFDELTCTEVRPGDILISRMADPLARACVVPDLGHSCITAVDVTVLRIGNRDRFSTEYVVYAMNSSVMNQQAEALASGTTRKRISRKNLARLSLPVPSRREQDRIVEAVDGFIASLSAAERDLEQAERGADVYLRSTLARCFGAASRSRKLGDVAATSSGGTPSRKEPAYFGGDIPWFKIGDLNDGVVTESEEHITPSGLKNSAARLLPAGTLLLAMYGSIGKLGVLGTEAATNQAICAIEPDPACLTRDYLYWFLRWRRPNLLAAGFGGTQANISQTFLKLLDIPIPDLEEQRTIVARCEEASRVAAAMWETTDQAHKRVASLRMAILRRAFRGELVSRDDRAPEVPTEAAAEVGDGPVRDETGA